MQFFSLLLPTITTQYIYIYIYNSIGICLSIDENHFVLSPHTHTHRHTFIIILLQYLFIQYIGFNIFYFFLSPFLMMIESFAIEGLQCYLYVKYLKIQNIGVLSVGVFALFFLFQLF